MSDVTHATVARRGCLDLQDSKAIQGRGEETLIHPTAPAASVATGGRRPIGDEDAAPSR